MSDYRSYEELLRRIDYETHHGSDDTRRAAAARHLPQAREAAKQVAEDRAGLALQWFELRRAWGEPAPAGSEPHRDHGKAAKASNWKFGAVLMFVIEATFASWLATTYLAAAVLPESPPLRLLFLFLVGTLITAAACVLFHKAMAVADDEKRPEPSYARFGRWAAVSSAIGLVSIAAFLLTRQYTIGGPVLQIALAVLTVSLAAGVAASLHCREVLHRPNRVASLHDAADKLLGRVSIAVDRLLSLAGTAGSGPGTAAQAGSASPGHGGSDARP